MEPVGKQEGRGIDGGIRDASASIHTIRGSNRNELHMDGDLDPYGGIRQTDCRLVGRPCSLRPVGSVFLPFVPDIAQDRKRLGDPLYRGYTIESVGVVDGNGSECFGPGVASESQPRQQAYRTDRFFLVLLSSVLAHLHFSH